MPIEINRYTANLPRENGKFALSKGQPLAEPQLVI